MNPWVHFGIAFHNVLAAYLSYSLAKNVLQTGSILLNVPFLISFIHFVLSSFAVAISHIHLESNIKKCFSAVQLRWPKQNSSYLIMQHCSSIVSSVSSEDHLHKNATLDWILFAWLFASLVSYLYQSGFRYTHLKKMNLLEDNEGEVEFVEPFSNFVLITGLIGFVECLVSFMVMLDTPLEVKIYFLALSLLLHLVVYLFSTMRIPVISSMNVVQVGMSFLSFLFAVVVFAENQHITRLAMNICKEQKDMSTFTSYVCKNFHEKGFKVSEYDHYTFLLSCFTMTQVMLLFSQWFQTLIVLSIKSRNISIISDIKKTSIGL